MSTKPGNSLVSGMAGDTIDNIRDALALVAAALAAPYDARPERAEIGATKILAAADEALEVLAREVPRTLTRGQQHDP